MKKLTFLRHAKSDWGIAGQKDFDRNLNERGVRNAPKMGIKLREEGLNPDLVLCSTAVRTRATADYILERMVVEEENVHYLDDLYEATPRSLMNVINEIDDKFSNVLIIGHNPSLTYLGEYLTKYDLGNVPTCGVVMMSFEIDSWKHLSQSTGNVDRFIYPSMLGY